MASEVQTYEELKQELDVIMSKLRNDDTSIDDAVVLHKEGTKLVKKLEKYLSDVSEQVAPKEK